MLLAFIIALCFFSAFYFAVLVRLQSGFNRLKPGSGVQRPFVSVIIAARNEVEDIGSCFESLVAQDYPADKHEVIVVNDRSVDRTPDIVDEFVRRDNRFQLLTISDTHTEMAPKKWALHRGIEQSRGEIILTTDADCVVKSGWISSMARYFTDEVGLVAGFSPLDRIETPSIFHRLIRLDGLALAGVAAGSFGAGMPLTCNGRNLAYRKSAYEEVGGFSTIGSFISGDDDLFMHLVRQNTCWDMRYNIDPESIVSSRPPVGFIEFVHQRLRHSSKTRHYPVGLTMGLIAVYLFNLFLLTAVFLPKLWPVLIIIFGVKSILEFCLLLRMVRMFRLKGWLRFFPLAALLHVPYVVVFGLWGLLGRFKWKGEVFRTKKIPIVPSD
jgi:cellulose synthase/poly-beta-1,6-N-acetylglucosamine synthase-like glycosyltransferase